MLGRSAAAACEREARNGLAANPLINSRRERSSDCMASAKNYTSYAQTRFLSMARCSVTLQVFLSPAQRLLKSEKREDLPQPGGPATMNIRRTGIYPPKSRSEPSLISP